MKLVDAFIFYNELDILYYRLSILYEIVDYFIIVESTRTFVGNQKPLFYSENKKRFSKFHDKIIHIVDEELLENPQTNLNVRYRYDDGVWNNEYHQRNSIDKGICQLSLSPNDRIFICDVDEIPDTNVLKQLKEEQFDIDYISFIQDMYYYNLTCKNSEKWNLPKLVSYKCYVNDLKREPQKCRTIHANYSVPNGGWHLSYFGDAKFIKNKIENFSHQEFNKDCYTDEESINKKMENNSDLFSRSYEKWEYIPISENAYLPPEYEKYLSKFTNHVK
jgi:beta-1,4-mannosyl-glycoprotein beta-1,4-N-acetylglucosaminyltransferase